jgi:hypothetical protein
MQSPSWGTAAQPESWLLQFDTRVRLCDGAPMPK